MFIFNDKNILQNRFFLRFAAVFAKTYFIINYVGMIPLLTGAIQEQQREIEELKKEMELLKKMLEKSNE